MPPKKGLSREDKMKIMKNLIMESKDIWTLKELEKVCPKKGISGMIVKDILKDLCDNDLISSDKIGSGNFFWCFPSEDFNQRRLQEEKLTNQIQSYQEEIAQLEKEIQELQKGREDSAERDQLDSEIAVFEQQIAEIHKESSKYEKMNPEALKQTQRQTQIAFDSANRWTDNIYTLSSWAQKKFFISSADFEKNFELGENFDYLQ